MKKTLTLTVALALVALGSVSWAATRPKSSRIMQKGGPPTTGSINLNSSKSNTYRVKVTKVDAKNKTFAVEVTFVAKAAPLPKKEEQVDVTFNPTPSGGPPEAVTVRARVRGSFQETRKAIDVADNKDSPEVMTGKVTQVNERDKTFTVEVTFDGKELKALPEVGKFYDITFTQTTPGGPPVAMKIDGSRRTFSPAP